MKIIFMGRKKQSADLLEWLRSQDIEIAAVCTDSQFENSPTARKARELGIPVISMEEAEKYVTEHAYNNPKFVEDVLRDVVIMLRKNEIIDSFEVECESMESIHNHSAWAYQQEG